MIFVAKRGGQFAFNGCDVQTIVKGKEYHRHQGQELFSCGWAEVKQEPPELLPEPDAPKPNKSKSKSKSKK